MTNALTTLMNSNNEDSGNKFDPATTSTPVKLQQKEREAKRVKFTLDQT